MTDSPQKWDDILADALVECGHCQGPMSPLPPDSTGPRYECLQHPHPACADAAMTALDLEDYVAHYLVAEMAKPAVVERLTRALFRHMETELPAMEQELAELEDRADVSASTIEAKRGELRAERRVLERYMDEDAFSPRWLTDWWNRRSSEHRKRQLCNLFFEKIEVRSGPAPAPDALDDERITLHWRRLG